MLFRQEGLNELVKGLLQEAGILKSISVLLSSDVPLEQPAGDKKKSRVTLAELLGEIIWEELSDCLIQNCLVNSIPTSSSKLEQYIEVGLKKSFRSTLWTCQMASLKKRLCFANAEFCISLIRAVACVSCYAKCARSLICGT